MNPYDFYRTILLHDELHTQHVMYLRTDLIPAVFAQILPDTLRRFQNRIAEILGGYQILADNQAPYDKTHTLYLLEHLETRLRFLDEGGGDSDYTNSEDDEG